MSTATLDPTELRQQRGLAIAALCKITEKNGLWIVPAQSGSGSYRALLVVNQGYTNTQSAKIYASDDGHGILRENDYFC